VKRCGALLAGILATALVVTGCSGGHNSSVRASIAVNPFTNLVGGQRVTVSGANWDSEHATVEQCYDDGTAHFESKVCDSATAITVGPSGPNHSFSLKYTLHDQLSTSHGTFVCSDTTGSKTNCAIVISAPKYSPATLFIKFTHVPPPTTTTEDPLCEPPAEC
jgi:hypothetical protein